MNNNILIGHLGWDGCHFLGSCLTMSDEVYCNNLTLRGKVEYFFKNMSKISRVDGKPVWNDVFMFHSTSYQSENYIHYRNAWINDFESDFDEFESDSSSKQQTRISRLHVPIYYSLSKMMDKNISHPIADMFKSKHFICLVNTQLFVALRSIKLEKDNRIDGSWDENFAVIPDIKWYDKPLKVSDRFTNTLDIKKYQSLSEELKEDLKKYNHSNIDDLFNKTKLFKSDNELLKSMITHQWDCNWFLNEDETVENLKILYSDMGLGKLNEKLIRKMYRVWVDKMDYIKKWYIKDETNFTPSIDQQCPQGDWTSEKWSGEVMPSLMINNDTSFNDN